MNEQIRQLAEQAMIQAPHEFGGTYLTFSKEKFAELIVRECTEVCKPVHAQPYEDMDEFHKGLIEGQDVAIEQIKQHFGVEE